MAAQYAFVMKDVTKSFPGAQKPVLNHINLQFYQGAKIGIVGPNGAGKSTLMKIMAGIDKEYQGEAWPGENITVGYLPQEPQLDPTKNVLENVKEGAREVADMVDRFNAISAEMGDPKDDTDFDALMEEMGELQGKIDAVDGWTSTTSSRSRWKRCAARRRIRRLRTFPAARSAGSRSRGC
jgi:ATPase subunit of ABC transporter with duplicated ATPase domains